MIKLFCIIFEYYWRNVSKIINLREVDDVKNKCYICYVWNWDIVGNWNIKDNLFYKIYVYV